MHVHINMSIHKVIAFCSMIYVAFIVVKQNHSFMDADLELLLHTKASLFLDRVSFFRGGRYHNLLQTSVSSI